MKYLKIFTDFLEITASLGDGALGRLFRAMLRYALDGTELPLKGKEGVLWTVARHQIDREKEAYESKVKHLKRGNGPVSKITDPVSNQDKDKDKEKEKEKDKDKEEDKDSLSACNTSSTTMRPTDGTSASSPSAAGRPRSGPGPKRRRLPLRLRSATRKCSAKPSNCIG